jgi:type II secretory pathway pseudopilin PulG
MNFLNNKKEGLTPWNPLWNLAKARGQRPIPRGRPKAYSTGFTMIELLTIVTIISLLTSISLYGMNEGRKRTRDAIRIHDITEIAQALDLYALSGGDFGSLSNVVSSRDGGPWNLFMQTLGLTPVLDPSNGVALNGIFEITTAPYPSFQKHLYTFTKVQAPTNVGVFLTAPVICTALESKKIAKTPGCSAQWDPVTSTNSGPPLGCAPTGDWTFIDGTDPWVCIKTGYNK